MPTSSLALETTFHSASRQRKSLFVARRSASTGHKQGFPLSRSRMESCFQSQRRGGHDQQPQKPPTTKSQASRHLRNTNAENPGAAKSDETINITMSQAEITAQRRGTRHARPRGSIFAPASYHCDRTHEAIGVGKGVICIRDIY